MRVCMYDARNFVFFVLLFSYSIRKIINMENKNHNNALASSLFHLF